MKALIKNNYEFIKKINAMNEENLKKYISNIQNIKKVYYYIENNWLPKSVIEKIFTIENAIFLCDKKLMPLIINTNNVFNLIKRFNMLDLLAESFLNSSMNIFNLIDMLSSVEYLTRINMIYKNSGDMPYPINKYIEYKFNNITLTNTEILDIANSKFRENFKSIQEIESNQSFSEINAFVNSLIKREKKK